MRMTGLVAMALLVAPGAVLARDTVLRLPLAEVLAVPDAQGKLDGSVKFFLSGTTHPTVTKQFGSDVSNRKTNGVGKSDEDACRWAALSALLAFQESAKRRGADAVINLVSYYKKREFKSSTDYECHAGGVVVGVALKGEYVSLGAQSVSIASSEMRSR